ncbi:MAG: carboxypeptidase regulatory-like domain-containing protein, partial [Deltaproteobacteria bacterium]|nr:carboxypeptidase regulatory-like domain-containing protein [Deltaproteobacteria bacterium]
EHVPGADYVVMADRKTAADAAGERGSARVSLRAHAEGVEVRLRQLMDLTGRVVDAEGKPLAGAEVDVESESPRPEDPGEQQLHTRSDANGVFALRGLSANAYALRVQSPDIYPVPLRQVTPGGAPLELKVGRCARIRARLVADDGSPLSQVRFNGELRDLEAGTFEQPVCDDLEAFPALKDRAVTFSVPGFVPRTAQVSGIQRGQTVDLGELKLDRPRGLRVNVVDAAGGAPLVAPDVRVLSPELEQVTARFTKKGEVRVDGLPPGTEKVRLLVPGFVPLELSVPAGDAPATAKLSRGLAVKGVVQNGAGLPSVGVKLRVVGAAGTHEVATDGNGRFTASGLLPGPVRVVLGGVRFGAQALPREPVEDVRHAVAGDSTELVFRAAVQWSEVSVRMGGGEVARAVVVSGHQPVDGTLLQTGEPWPAEEGAAREAWVARHPWGDPGIDVAGVRTARQLRGALDFGRLGNGAYTLLAESRDGKKLKLPFEMADQAVELAAEFPAK